jgi:3-(3-hydroxy-phenyl)propionate hydroxylase
LNGPDDARLPARTRVGATLVDAPTDRGWLSDRIGGRFQLFTANSEFSMEGMDMVDVIVAPDDLIAERYLGEAEEAVYLMRPDQIVAARWVSPSAVDVQIAMKSAMGG